MDNHTVLSRRTFGSVAAVAALALATTGSATAATPTRPAAAGTAPLTNLSHLDFLLAEVPLVAVEGHTTWQIAERPMALAPWTYADGLSDGSYTAAGRHPEPQRRTRGTTGSQRFGRVLLAGTNCLGLR